VNSAIVREQGSHVTRVTLLEIAARHLSQLPFVNGLGKMGTV